MNTDHEIYREREDLIPPEDNARLDGYLAGRAEETRLAREKFQRLVAQNSPSELSELSTPDTGVSGG